MLATLPLDMIENGQRLRGISEAQVEALVNSIGDVGLLNPITVYRRKVLRGGGWVDGYGLVAGLHRKTACERLGLVEIEANVLELSDLECQIAECDENLCAPRLSPADRARFTSRRKEAYLALHPETREHVAGGKGNATAENFAAVPSFAADTAAKTGTDERTVRLHAERGDKVIDEVLDLVLGTRLDPTDLRSIAVAGLVVGMTLKRGDRLCLIQGSGDDELVCYRWLAADVTVASTIAQALLVAPRLPIGIFAEDAIVRFKDPFCRLAVVPGTLSNALSDDYLTTLAFEVEEALR